MTGVVVTRRTINLVLIFTIFAILTGALWFYYVSIQLTSRETAAFVSSVVEKVLGGKCQIGKLTVSGLSKLHVSSLVVFREDNSGELFNISSGDIYIAFPKSLTGQVEVTRIVLNEPSFELKGQASGGITQILGGAIKEEASSIQVEVKNGTVRLTPLPEFPDFVLTVGPIDMFLLSPQGKKMPILRGTSSVLGSKFEVFAEYFTAPERVLFKYYLSEFDLTEVEKLTKGSLLPFSLIGGRAELKGSYTIAKRGNDNFSRITLRDAEIELKNGLKFKLNGTLNVIDNKVSLGPGFKVSREELGIFSVSGSSSGLEDPLGQFTIDCPDLNLGSLKAVLPSTWVESVAPDSIEGSGVFHCSVNGSPLDIASYSGTVDLSAATFAYGTIPLSCERLTFNGSTLDFQSLSVKTAGGTLNGDLSFTGTSHQLKLSLEGEKLSADVLHRYLLENANPPVFLKNMECSGEINGLFKAQGVMDSSSFKWKEWIRKSSVTGRLSFGNVSVKGKKSSLRGKLRGSLHLDDSKLRLYDISLSHATYKTEFTGIVEDVFSTGSLSLAVKIHGKGVDGIPVTWLWENFGSTLPSVLNLSKKHGLLLTPQGGEAWLNATMKGTLQSPKVFGEIKHSGLKLNVQKKGDEESWLFDFNESRIAFDGRSLWSDSSVVKSPFGEFDYGINVRFSDLGDPVLSCELAPVDDKILPFLPFVNFYLKSEKTDNEKMKRLFGNSTVSGSLKLNGTTASPLLKVDIRLLMAYGSSISVKGGVKQPLTDSSLDLMVGIGGVKGISLEVVRYLVPGLLSSPFAFWMKENGFVKGKILAKGPVTKTDLSGKLSVETKKQEKWSLVLETKRNKESLYSLTARCAKGRLERLVPLLWEKADLTLRPYAIRQPFEGIIRWTALKDGGSTLAGKMKLGKGAFDLPSPNSALVEMDVLSGLVSFISKSGVDGPVVKTNLEVTLKSPLEEVDPAPVVIKVVDAVFKDQQLSFKELSLLLFGEKFISSGTIDKTSNVGRLNIDMPATTYSLARLARKTLPLNAGISFNGELIVEAHLKGTAKYPELTGGMAFTNVHLESYYQKGIPLSFPKAEIEFSNDNIFFKPFPVKLGIKDATFPAVGGLKKVLATDNVWRMIFLHPMDAWKKIKDHIGNIDQQQLISRAIGKDEYGKILRSSAHRIKTWIWTETRNAPYVYEAFLTNDEGLAFDNTSDDIVLRYEEIARRNLAAKEGFSVSGFGDSASKMLRIRRIESSVLDRDGNQIWPEEIPKWRLDSTPGVH